MNRSMDAMHSTWIIVKVVASEVRGIGVIRAKDSKGRDVGICYHVDVHPRPLEENPAHAQIEADPTIASDSLFRRVKEMLALLAARHGWIIRPSSIR